MCLDRPSERPRRVQQVPPRDLFDQAVDPAHELVELGRGERAHERLDRLPPVDGCGRVRTLAGIVLPPSLPGIVTAASATPKNDSAANRYVTGSPGVTPKTSVETTPRSPIAAAMPIARPTTTSRAPCTNKSPKTFSRVAPSAKRIPISWVRCVTTYATRPYTPIAASISAATANAEINHAIDRGAAGERRWYVRLRGEQKDTFTVWFTLRQRTLHYETYVMPAPEENHGHPLGGLLYAFSVLDCLGCGTSEAGGAGLGTLGLPEPVARRMTAEAGFTRFKPHDFRDPGNLYYEVRR